MREAILTGFENIWVCEMICRLARSAGYKKDDGALLPLTIVHERIGRRVALLAVAVFLALNFCSTPPATGSRENYRLQCDELQNLIGNWEDENGILCLCTHSTYPLVIEKAGEDLAYFWIVDADKRWSDYRLEIYHTGHLALFTNRRQLSLNQTGELVYSYDLEHYEAIKVPIPRTMRRHSASGKDCPFPEPEWSPNRGDSVNEETPAGGSEFR